MQEKSTFKAAIFAGILSLSLSSSVLASGFYLPAIGFNNGNPAELGSVKRYQILIDGLAVNANYEQSDLITNLIAPGQTVRVNASGRRSFFLPSLSMAYRANPKWVLGLNVSHPAMSGPDWGPNFLLNNFARAANSVATDFSPRFSYSLNPRVILGMGLDITQVYGALLLGGTLSPGFSLGNASGWGLGWDAGVFVILTPSTFLSVGGNSEISTTGHGYSSIGPIFVRTAATFVIPTTFTLRLTQMLSKRWLAQFLGVWDEQSEQYQVGLRNVVGAGYLPLTTYWANSFLLQLFTRYQINQRWGFGVGGSYEDNPTNLYWNQVAFPISAYWALFLGPDVQLNKVVNLQFYFGHLWVPSRPINTLQFGVFPILGSAKTSGNIIEFRLNIKA